MTNSEEKNRHLLIGVTIIFIANIFGTFFNVISNFFLPKYLSVEAYAGIKLYELYYTYIGIFHFGFIDGVYLEYGGKSFKSLSEEDIALKLNTFRWAEIICMLILMIIASFLHNDIFFFVVLSIPTLNIISFFQLLYQATGEYSSYSKILNVTTFFKTVLNFSVLLFISRTNYKIYLTGYTFLNLAIALWLEISIRIKKVHRQSFFHFSLSILIQEIKSGLALRISILSGFLLSGMDRIFVKTFMDTIAFAQYAFAVTVENILNVMITPVTTTLYNYFCNEPDDEQIRMINNIVTITSATVVLLFFPVKFILILFLDNYLDAAVVLALLFASKSLYIIIQGIYVNLYKAKKEQNKYLKKLTIVICTGAITNLSFYWMLPLKEAFALATLVTSYIWLAISILDFKRITFRFKNCVYIVLCNGLFLMCSYRISVIAGFILYFLFVLIMSFIIFPKELKAIIFRIEKYIKK